MVPYLAQAQHLGAKVNAKKHLKKRGQQAVSLAELTPQVMDNPSRMHELERLWQSDEGGPEIFRLEVTMFQLAVAQNSGPCSVARMLLYLTVTLTTWNVSSSNACASMPSKLSQCCQFLRQLVYELSEGVACCL